MLFPFSQIFEVVCLFFAFRYLTGTEKSFWKSFRWFLLVTVLLETAGFILQNTGGNNHWIYNLYLPIEVLFKFYVFYKLCKGYFKVQYWLLGFLAIFAILYLSESIDNGFREYSYVSNSVASVAIIILCCFYFYYFLKKEEYVNIYEHAPFWVITALFFFYLGTTACNIFFNYLASIYVKQHIPIRYITFTMLNFIMYGCWSYSFVCKYRQTISSS